MVFPLNGRTEPTIAPCIAITSSEISSGIRFGIMQTILRLIGSMGLVAMLFAWHVGPRTARADDCLAQPNSSASAGTRWYYHTDRATQRKCWYLRASDQPAQEPAAQTTSKTTLTSPIPLEKPATASGAAPMSVTPDAGTPPQPHIKMLSVVSRGTTDKLNQQSAKQRNTTSITTSPAAEESTSQTGVLATEPTRGAAIVWPDPPTPPIATVQDPITTLTSAPTESAPMESVQPASGVRASAHDAEDTPHAGAPTNSAAEARTALVSEPVEMSLLAAFGLVVAGFLFRIVMTARRRRIFIDPSESHWMDYRNERELHDEQQHAGSVHQREELIDDFIDRPESHWMDDRNEHKLRDRQQPSGPVWQWHKKPIHNLQRSVIPTASDYRPSRPFRNHYESQENPQRTDHGSDVADEISKPEDMLEQLRRDLDRLLRSPKVA